MSIILPLLGILAIIALILPLVLYIVFFKKINKIIELRVVFYYMIASILGLFIDNAFRNYATITLSIWAMAEMLFFSAIFYFILRSQVFKTVVMVLTALVLAFFIFLFISHKSNFDFWVALCTTLLVFVYCILYFYEQVSTPQNLIIYQSHSFWVAIGCILYLAGTLFIFLYTSDIKDKQKSPLWAVNIVFEMIKNIFFSVAFLIGRNSKKNQEVEELPDTNMFENPF